MSQSCTKTIRRLTQALEDGSPVTIRRDGLDVATTSGMVVALADEWVALHDVIEGPHLDAVVLLRLDHVTKVERHRPDSYLARAVVGIGAPVKQFEVEPDATIADLLRVAQARGGLVLVRMEEWEGEPLYVGRIRRVGAKRVDLQFIGRDGVWVDFVDAWRMSDITSFEIAGRYVDALDQFGDPMPPPGRRVKRSSGFRDG